VARHRLIWYVAYGSNMLARRLHYYLAGGQPPGARRRYPGARDRRPPRANRPVMLSGGVYFALESPTWTGGLAFYDPNLPGRAAARAYLMTAQQFSDVAAQEMHRAPGTDLDIDSVVEAGRLTVGPGRYETILHAGDADGIPMLTFTAPWQAHQAEPKPPAARYLSMLAAGLRETHGWSAARTAAYLRRLPGVTPRLLTDEAFAA